MSTTASSRLNAEPETIRIANQLRRAYEGPAWHGPALKDILADVDEGSAGRSANGSHSVWEIVLHITTWLRVARERLGPGVRADVTPEEDWPRPEGSWREALSALDKEEQALEQAIREFPEERLADPVAASEPQTFYILLHGAVQHSLYHAGQIVLLIK
jgi:uncharacterized damage-inducible protein DinB